MPSDDLKDAIVAEVAASWPDRPTTMSIVLEVADTAAKVARERLAAKDAELAQLKADMRIRQGALADALGVPRHDDPTSYYANVEAVADLRRELDRNRPAPAEEPGETR